MSIDKYFPETEQALVVYSVDKSLSKEDRAFSTWKALLSAKRNMEAMFLVMGKLLKDIRDDKLFEVLDYENFSQFLNSEELSFSREKAYMVIRVYEYFIEHLGLPEEKVREMSVSRLSLMMPALKKIANKDEALAQIEEFNSLRHNDFVREVKNKSNKNGKPTVYWSEELDKWYVGYYPEKSHLHDLGEYQEV